MSLPKKERRQVFWQEGQFEAKVRRKETAFQSFVKDSKCLSLGYPNNRFLNILNLLK